MSRPRGYKMAFYLRHRDKERRGGIDPKKTEPSSFEGSMNRCIDRHIEWLRIRNSSESGLKSRRTDLYLFANWAKDRDLIRPQQITRPILDSYQRWLWYYRKSNGQPLTTSTQGRRLCFIKTFFSWMCREWILEANPASEMVLPRSEKRITAESLSIQEVESILSVPDIGDPLGLRDRAMLELLYSSALRRSEAVRLDVGDVNRDRQTLHIRKAKGYKDRIVPIGKRALVWLEKYINEVRPLLIIKVSEPRLFLTVYGEGFNADVFGRKVSSYIRKADIGRDKGGTHLFRHACATHMLEGGADIRYIQQLLGHSSLEATAAYTYVSILKLQNIHANTHPAEHGKGVEKSSL